MIRIQTIAQVQRSIGSTDGVDTNKRTDGRTDVQTDSTDCFTFLTNANVSVFPSTDGSRTIAHSFLNLAAFTVNTGMKYQCSLNDH